MFKLIGKEHKVGNYQGKDYDNTVLHCMTELPNNAENDGFKVETKKVKATVKPYQAFIVGDFYETYYDNYGNVAVVNKIERKE